MLSILYSAVHMIVLRRIVAAVFVVLAVSAASAQTYKAIANYKVSGSSAKAIAVDGSSRRLFIAAGDNIAILNADTGEPAGSISGLTSVQDVLIVPEMKGEEKVLSTMGYASDSAGNVMEFSLADLKPLATIKLDTAGATNICYDAEAKTIEAVSAAGALTSIDPATNKVIKSAKLPTGLGQIVCGNMGHVYVADPAGNVVHVLNHETMENDGDYPMKSGHNPSGLALDPKGRRLFVTCEDGVIEIIDTDSGFTFIELKGGKGAAYETFAWVPQGKGQWKAAAFVVQQDGTLSGIRMMAYINYIMGGQSKLPMGLSHMAYDDKTHHLFITAISSGAPVVIVAGY